MKKFLGQSFFGLILLLGSHSASAGMEFVSGEWKLTVGGNVEAFYAMSKCGSPNTIFGGVTCAGQEYENSIQSGYLPAGLILGINTTQFGIDLGATFYITSGINSALANTSFGGLPIDARLVFMTAGSENYGTFTFGRNLGIFGREAVRNDITSHGIGGIYSQQTPSTAGTYGYAGSGYVHPDFLPQISYATPDWMGLHAEIGAFQPMNAATSNVTASGIATLHTSPALQAGLFHAWDMENFSSKFWSGFLFQNHQARGPGEFNFNSIGVDGGVKLCFTSAYSDLFNLQLIGYGYWGKGLGTTVLFRDAISILGSPRESTGGFAQAAYKIGTLKIGAGYGLSALKQAPGDNLLLVNTNQTITGGLYFALTPAFVLTAEYAHVESVNGAGAKNAEDTGAVGAIFSF